MRIIEPYGLELEAGVREHGPRWACLAAAIASVQLYARNDQNSCDHLLCQANTTMSGLLLVQRLPSQSLLPQWGLTH